MLISSIDFTIFSHLSCSFLYSCQFLQHNQLQFYVICSMFLGYVMHFFLSQDCINLPNVNRFLLHQFSSQEITQETNSHTRIQ